MLYTLRSLRSLRCAVSCTIAPVYEAKLESRVQTLNVKAKGKTFCRNLKIKGGVGFLKVVSCSNFVLVIRM